MPSILSRSFGSPIAKQSNRTLKLATRGRSSKVVYIYIESYIYRVIYTYFLQVNNWESHQGLDVTMHVCMRGRQASTIRLMHSETSVSRCNSSRSPSHMAKSPKPRLHPNCEPMCFLTLPPETSSPLPEPREPKSCNML